MKNVFLEIGYEDSFCEDKTMIKIREFLQVFIKAFCDLSYSRYMSSGGFIFLNRYLETSIRDILFEMSEGRYKTEDIVSKISKNLAKYAIKIDEDTILLLEFERDSYMCIYDCLGQHASRKWAAINQKTDQSDIDIFLEKDNQKIYKISFMIIISSYKSPKKDGYIEINRIKDAHSIMGMLDEEIDDEIIKTAQSFRAYWDLTKDKTIYEPVEFFEGFEFYPQIYFVGRVV